MIILTTPIVVKNLTRLKVQSVKYEANLERGQEWAEVWCDLGYLEAGLFVAYPDPATKISARFFKFENGMHPAVPGMMLGRCPVCNDWHFKVSGPCDRPACVGIVAAFASYTRFRNRIDASTLRDVFAATDAFLTNSPAGEGQVFPNPDILTVVGPLIAGTP